MPEKAWPLFLLKIVENLNTEKFVAYAEGSRFSNLTPQTEERSDINALVRNH